MGGVIAPFPRHQFFDNVGDPANGYKLFTYAAGTSTKVDTYTDVDLLVPNDNPITLDSAGRCVIFLDQASYKFVLATPTTDDPPTSPLWTIDNVAAPAPFDQTSGWIRTGTNVHLTTITDQVGIGTATPSNKLVVGDDIDVNPTAPDNAISIGHSDGDAILQVGQDISDVLYVGWGYNATPANAYAYIGTGGNGQHLRIQGTSNGYVAIGNFTPSNKLVVNSDACGAVVAAATVAVASASENALFTCGQGPDDRVALTWVYNATPANASGQLGTGTNAQRLSIQPGGGSVGVGFSGTVSNKVVVNADSCGAGTVPGSTIAVGNPSADSYLLVGQSATARLFVGWAYNATESLARGTINTTTSTQHLRIQAGGGKTAFGAAFIPTNALVVNADSCGASGVPGSTVAVGNASADSFVMLGQSSTAHVYLQWDRNATEGSASAVLSTAAATQPLYLQSVGGAVSIDDLAPTIGGTFDGSVPAVDDCKLVIVSGTEASPRTSRDYNMPLVYVELWDNSTPTTGPPNKTTTWADPEMVPAVVIETRAESTGEGNPCPLACRARSDVAVSAAGQLHAITALGEVYASAGTNRDIFTINAVASWQVGGTISNLVVMEADAINGVTDAASGLPGTGTPFVVGYWAQCAGSKIATVGVYVSTTSSRWRYGIAVTGSCDEWGAAIRNAYAGGHGLIVQNYDDTNNAARVILEVACGATWGAATRNCLRVTQETGNPVYVHVASALRQVTRGATDGGGADAGFKVLQVPS